MEKLQKYNQKLLAIIGTLALLTIAGLLIFALVMYIVETSRRDSNRQITDNSLTIEDTTDSTMTDTKKFDQDITFGNPRLIDTLNTIYLVPVSQVNLANQLNGNYEEPILHSGSRRYAYGKKSFYRYSGEYNNIVVYNQLNDEKHIIFDSKVYITMFTNRVVNDDHYILITGVSEDSNKDKKLNESDLKALYVYSIKDKELKMFGIEGHDFEDYYFEHETSKVLLRFAIDKDENGEINSLHEPVIIKELDFTTWTLNNFLPETKLNELKEIIN